ncbi:hypothetical protein JCM11251_001379 [Rhodosporidiobolus azoricus]
MGDDRFTYRNLPLSLASHLLDEEDERLGWDLPDDDIFVPAHLLPPYQDEDDETILPSQAHPSYPYGNPHKPNLTSSPSRRSTASVPHSSFFTPSTHSASLSTTLPALELRDLFARTTFGESTDRQWSELHLGGWFGRKTRRERDEDEEERMQGREGHGDAGPPAGQNAGDAVEEEEEEEEQGGTEGDRTGDEGMEGSQEGQRER